VQRTVTTRLRLRDGESNLLAGLMQQNDSHTVTGFPGAIHVPFFRQLFSGNNISSDQTEIVMLLTPHIVRTQELTESDLKPIFIGSQQNLGLGGPPPLIAPPEETPGQPGAGAAPAAPPALVAPGVAAPPGSSPVPGTVPVPVPAAPAPPNAAPPAGAANPPAANPPAPNPPAATPPAAAQPLQAPPAQPPTITTPGVGSAQIIISPPGTTFRVGGGPYTIPLSVTNAAGLSTVTLTLAYDPMRLRVRSVQQGSFMQAGGVNVVFTQQSTTPGRIDITLTRAADATGATGTGLLAAVLFDAIAPGNVTLTLSGVATGPGGTPMGLQFRPVTITVQ
jgi:general secretion pathway protein D